MREALPAIVLSRSHHALLETLVDRPPPRTADDALDRLSLELARARVVADGDFPAGVAALGSRIRYRAVDTGVERDLWLVLPRDADPSTARISVLAPVGSALLGLSAGQTIAWPLPGGRVQRYHVVEVTP
jgi:regulator of nucleoside diphosphate kinase